MQRRFFLRGAVLCPLALSGVSRSALSLAPDPAQSVTAIVDFSAEGASGETAGAASAITPLEKWAGFGSDGASKPIVFASDPPGLLSVRAVRNAQTRQVGICLTNPTNKPAKITLDTRLGSGLWRGEAASVTKNESSDGAGATVWRMESALRSVPGAVIKTLPLAAGQTLALRFSETVQAAQTALHDLQTRTASLGVTTYSGENVPNVLGNVDNLLANLPIIIEKNNRPDVVKRTHRALLLLAQAEAMSQNAQQAARDASDAAFDAVTLALSEISCAAWNLVLRQTIESAGDKQVLRVTLTNGGSRVLPVVSLSASGVSDLSTKNARPVFRSVSPGTSVSARFVLLPGDEKTARGVAQWIVEMGAASVYAATLVALEAT